MRNPTHITIAMTVLLSPLFWAMPVHAALITFDAVVVGETTFSFDGDGDSVDDVIFSTTDPNGFNTAGPGPNMTYINEPGLEGTSLLNPDLRVDFLNGAIGPLSFGFSLDSSFSDPSFFASIEVFNSDGNLIGSASQVGNFTITVPPSGLSSFPEGLVTVDFSGAASFATFDFTSEFGRYIIDNFEGTFGSTEDVTVPEPGSLVLLVSAGFLGLSVFRKRSA